MRIENRFEKLNHETMDIGAFSLILFLLIAVNDSLCSCKNKNRKIENNTILWILERGRANVAVALSNFVLYIPEMAGDIQRIARLDCYTAPLDAIVTASTLNRRKTQKIFEMQEDGIT